MSLPLKIAEARKNKGLTQEELAERASVTVRTIQRIESAESVPRSFTLKAIAQALDIPFEDLKLKESSTPQITHGTHTEDIIHILKMINFSCFVYLVLPYTHFLVPMHLLRKHKGQGMRIRSIGRKIVKVQIGWVVTTNLIMLLAVVYNIGYAQSHTKNYLSYLWAAIAMYFLNAIIIIATHFRIRNLVSR
jgi:XRE family transcriptional regulator, regulator of sulfur utilization